MFFRKQTFLCPALLAAAAYCLSSTGAADLQIKASDIADVKNADDSHQMLEKKWTFSGKEIEKITIGTVGSVFVSYTDKIDGVAVVRVSGDSKDIINAFKVDSEYDNDPSTENALRVELDTKSLDAKGYLLTEVMLANKAKVDVVHAGGSANVVIGENVLASNSDSSLAIQAGGAGNMFLDSKSALEAASLDIKVAGAGSVMVATDGLTIAKNFNASVAGAGSLSITSSKVDAADASVGVAGAGDFCMGATAFTTKTLLIHNAGTGRTKFNKGGKCTTATVSTAGVGGADIGGVACESVELSVYSVGKTVVQASSSLSVSGSGDVTYVGDKPTKVTPEGAAKAGAGTASIVECDVKKAPKRETKEVTVTRGSNIGAKSLAMPSASMMTTTGMVTMALAIGQLML